MEYYEKYAKLNNRKGNRHLYNSPTQFKLFIAKDFISPVDNTDNFYKRFRQFLLDKFIGKTPGNYYAKLKWVINAATSYGYFQKNTEHVAAKSKRYAKLKSDFELEAYLILLNTPFFNEEVEAALIFVVIQHCNCRCKKVRMEGYNGWNTDNRIIQAKTGESVTLTLHHNADFILEKAKKKHSP